MFLIPAIWLTGVVVATALAIAFSLHRANKQIQAERAQKILALVGEPSDVIAPIMKAQARYAMGGVAGAPPPTEEAVAVYWLDLFLYINTYRNVEGEHYFGGRKKTTEQLLSLIKSLSTAEEVNLTDEVIQQFLNERIPVTKLDARIK